MNAFAQRARFGRSTRSAATIVQVRHAFLSARYWRAVRDAVWLRFGSFHVTHSLTNGERARSPLNCLTRLYVSGLKPLRPGRRERSNVTSTWTPLACAPAIHWSSAAVW